MTLHHAAAVREQLGHPVIDIDGHTIEYFPVLDEYLREEGVDPSSPERAAQGTAIERDVAALADAS